jgi:hypothetical protein
MLLIFIARVFELARRDGDHVDRFRHCDRRDLGSDLLGPKDALFHSFARKLGSIRRKKNVWYKVHLLFSGHPNYLAQARGRDVDQKGGQRAEKE